MPRPIGLLALAPLALAAAVPAQAATVLETFETAGPTETALSSLVLPIGTFTPAYPATNLFIAPPGYNNFGPGIGVTTTTILTGDYLDGITLTLADAARTVAMDVYLNDLGPASLTFYDGSTVLQSFSYAADGSSANNLVHQSYTSPGALITSFTFVSSKGNLVNTGIDNVSATSAVPEPAGWAMMLAGFAAVGGAMRRRGRLALRRMIA